MHLAVALLAQHPLGLLLLLLALVLQVMGMHPLTVALLVGLYMVQQQAQAVQACLGVQVRAASLVVLQLLAHAWVLRPVALQLLVRARVLCRAA